MLEPNYNFLHFVKEIFPGLSLEFESYYWLNSLFVFQLQKLEKRKKAGMMWVIDKEELTSDRNVAISEKDANNLNWNSYFILVEIDCRSKSQVTSVFLSEARFAKG